jgi:hypothetical protein
MGSLPHINQALVSAAFSGADLTKLESYYSSKWGI